MVRTIKVKAFIVGITLAAALLAGESAAIGVTLLDGIETDSSDFALTTGAATRARADVQIRRIKTLLVSRAKPFEQDAAIEKLEKLQKDLRGQR